MMMKGMQFFENYDEHYAREVLKVWRDDHPAMGVLALVAEPDRGIETALSEIEENRGILYDVDVVDACTRLFREKQFAFS